MSATSSGERGTIGVVLPLTGKLENYGRKALDSILLAAKSYFPNQDDGLNIIVEDTKSNPLLAANAVEKLVNQDHVMAIIGPLTWKESIYAADKAQELGVLNISLSSNVVGTTFSWTVAQNGVSGASAGSGSLIHHFISTTSLKKQPLLVIPFFRYFVILVAYFKCRKIEIIISN